MTTLIVTLLSGYAAWCVAHCWRLNRCCRGSAPQPRASAWVSEVTIFAKSRAAWPGVGAQ